MRRVGFDTLADRRLAREGSSDTPADRRWNSPRAAIRRRIGAWEAVRRRFSTP